MWFVEQHVTVQTRRMAAVAVDLLHRVAQGAETTRGERVGKSTVMSRHFNYWIHSGWVLFVFVGVPLTFRDNSNVAAARRIMMGAHGLRGGRVLAARARLARERALPGASHPHAHHGELRLLLGVDGHLHQHVVELQRLAGSEYS
jgi:hypothetical protein